VAHQWLKLLGGSRIAAIHLQQKASHIGHSYEDSQRAAETPENVHG